MKAGVRQKKKPYVRKIPTSTSRVMYVRLDPSICVFFFFFFFLHLFSRCDGAALSFYCIKKWSQATGSEATAYLRHKTKLCLSRCDKFWLFISFCLSFVCFFVFCFFCVCFLVFYHYFLFLFLCWAGDKLKSMRVKHGKSFQSKT